MAQEAHALHTEHVSGRLLLTLARPGKLLTSDARVVGALVAGRGQYEVDQDTAPGHLQDGAAAVELDVVRMGDDAECTFDAAVLGAGEELACRHRAPAIS